jgi:hypothetical protein
MWMPPVRAGRQLPHMRRLQVRQRIRDRKMCAGFEALPGAASAVRLSSLPAVPVPTIREPGSLELA